MNRFHRILFLGLALMGLAVLAPTLSPLVTVVALFTAGTCLAIEVLLAVLSLAGVQVIAPSPSARFAAPLTGEPERTAFA